MFNFFQFFSWAKTNYKSDDLNTLTVNDYYERLKLIALSLFEWENLPDSCNARFLEESLYMYGRAVFINDKKLGFLNMKCTPASELNVYDEPIKYTAYSHNYNTAYDRDECVLIRNNYLERPTDLTVILFATRLTTAERTIDTNIHAQKTPVLVSCDEKDRLTVLNLYKQYEGNHPFILGAKSLNPDALKVLKTEAPFVALELQNYKHQIWNEALTFFGINNANSDKRERLITDEVNANNEVININAQAVLLTRQEACEKINKLYDLSFGVKDRNFNLENEAETSGKEDE